MEKITHEKFLEFRMDYYTTGCQSVLRLGQAFLNKFYPHIPDDELYYCADINQCYAMIYEKYVHIPD